MIRSKRLASLLLLALLLTCTTLIAGAAPPPLQIERWVISAGGGPASTKALDLLASFGQPIAGQSESKTLDLRWGYRLIHPKPGTSLPSPTPSHALYLPLFRH